MDYTGPFHGLLASWQLALEAANKSPRTVENYTEGVVRLTQWLETHGHDTDVRTLTAEQIRGWLVDLAGQMSEATVRGRYIAVKLFLTWCLLEGELDTHPMATIPQPKVSPKIATVLTTDQLQLLLRDTQGRDFADLRDRALVMFFGDTGCRVSEVADLRLPDVDLRDRSAVVTGKGSRQRVVPYGSATAQALDRYLRARRRQRYGDRDWFWLSSTAKGRFTAGGIQQALRKRGQRLGFHIHPHMFRHTFADAWLRAGGSEGDLMELTGWVTREMVTHYAAATRSDRARRAYQGNSPMDRL